jgi:aminoglycoside phosphotransferase (APT) family kinase protein
VRDQFPEYAHLPVTDVALSGWDNRTFRLGEDLSVRLPSADGYIAQVEKEQQWLPRLAPHLPLPIPAPVAMGRPSPDYPWPWSINRWLPGELVAVTPVTDMVRFATDLAGFLAALYRVNPTGGPRAGVQSFYRGASLAAYDAQTRESIAALADEIDPAVATAIWERALAEEWTGEPVWFHGDIAVGNLLVSDGCLSAVIDFGTSGVGDPACDTVIAWTFFTGESRAAFVRELPLGPEYFIRGRGWALWKCLITLLNPSNSTLPDSNEQRRILHEILSDPVKA